MKFICHIVQIIKNTMLKWKQKDESARNYSIIIYDENAMKIGNKDTQYNVSKKNHATITQRYKCLLHAKLGNQPYPDYINVSYMLSLVINHIQMIYIDYYMAFFISYPLSAWGHDISPRADRLKGWYMNEGW
jgi:hypothetical protein